MTTSEICWKCKNETNEYAGKMSNNGNFTCFPCLKKWTISMRPIWKKEDEQHKKELQKKPVNQMSFFELQENLIFVFT